MTRHWSAPAHNEPRIYLMEVSVHPDPKPKIRKKKLRDEGALPFTVSLGSTGAEGIRVVRRRWRRQVTVPGTRDNEQRARRGGQAVAHTPAFSSSFLFHPSSPLPLSPTHSLFPFSLGELEGRKMS